ncbi:hypothetical protein CXB51_006137 [Gossypium anomalum]|uniref:Peptidyl-prolyl cis-trans isomerase n=1 Tax=Gossypium anomalum TaxID=47600 RepID=A0A8J5Z392_9ROSI|nr:hypothetical protein CXB51_006137 [Gossypium anomalum]
MARIKPQALLIQSKKKKGSTRISVTTILFCSLIVLLISLSLITTYKHWSQRFAIFQPYLRLLLLCFPSSLISLKVNLFREWFPLLIAAGQGVKQELGCQILRMWMRLQIQRSMIFLDMLQKGHFKGMPFHHVIKNYVILGGHSQDSGGIEDWTSKRKFHRRLPTSPKHEAFMLGTTKIKEDSKAFQLFITTAPIPDSNDKLYMFGRVIKGVDVVQEIEEVDTDTHYRPKSPVGIINVILQQVI